MSSSPAQTAVADAVAERYNAMSVGLWITVGILVLLLILVVVAIVMTRRGARGNTAAAAGILAVSDASQSSAV